MLAGERYVRPAVVALTYAALVLSSVHLGLVALAWSSTVRAKDEPAIRSRPPIDAYLRDRVGCIRGRVVDPGGTPASGATVTALDMHGLVARADIHDEAWIAQGGTQTIAATAKAGLDGRFEIRPGPGLYRLVAVRGAASCVVHGVAVADGVPLDLLDLDLGAVGGLGDESRAASSPPSVAPEGLPSLPQLGRSLEGRWRGSIMAAFGPKYVAHQRKQTAPAPADCSTTLRVRSFAPNSMVEVALVGEGISELTTTDGSGDVSLQVPEGALVEARVWGAPWGWSGVRGVRALGPTSQLWFHHQDRLDSSAGQGPVVRGFIADQPATAAWSFQARLDGAEDLQSSWTVDETGYFRVAAAPDGDIELHLLGASESEMFDAALDATFWETQELRAERPRLWAPDLPVLQRTELALPSSAEGRISVSWKATLGPWVCEYAQNVAIEEWSMLLTPESVLDLVLRASSSGRSWSGRVTAGGEVSWEELLEPDPR